MPRFAALILSLFAVAGPPAAAEVPDLGPVIGAAVPVAVAGVDHQGKARQFADLSGDNGMILMFSRSIEWCPYCQRQAIDANSRAADFAALGMPLVLLTYDPVEKLARFAGRQNIAYTLLSDPESKIIDGFGLRNTDFGPESIAHGVPHPAIFLIDAKGIIRAKLMEEGYKARPEIADVLAAAQSLAQN